MRLPGSVRLVKIAIGSTKGPMSGHLAAPWRGGA